MPSISITNNGVYKLLDSINPNKAQGPDELPARVLKETASEITPILTEIYNKSLQTGIVPDDWRNANISPIFKKGEKHIAGNYRPVSLTSICCKHMEHILVKHILEHLDNHSILKDCQHGFRSRRSCETQLVTFVQELVDTMPGGGQTDVILMDFSKAFDKVPHQRLLRKLHHYGIRGDVLRWTENFLAQRKQRVILDGTTSEYAHVRSGVPQGTVLGPLLFLVYINDLPDSAKSKVRLFADDAVLYRQINSRADCETLQRDLDSLLDWESKWQMSFHPDKCKVMSITRARKRKQSFSYHIRETLLEMVKSAAYLGLEMDEKLDWSPHINKVTAKATRSLNFIRRNLQIGSQSVKSSAYRGLVRPSLDYCSIVWNPNLARHIQQVEMIQRRATRFVLNRYHNTSSVGEMLQTLGWETLQERRAKCSVVFMYKILNQMIAVPATPYFVPAYDATRGLRVHKLLTVQGRTDYHRASYFVRVIPLWNRLPDDIAGAPSINTFKEKLAAQLLIP